MMTNEHFILIEAFYLVYEEGEIRGVHSRFFPVCSPTYEISVTSVKICSAAIMAFKPEFALYKKYTGHDQFCKRTVKTA